MSKAFTEKEKNRIRTDLMEAALDLFHEKGVKTMSIRALTERAGIAQGTFYRFWKDKDALVLDVMKYRATQKLQAIVPLFSDSLTDPAGTLSGWVCDWCNDLKVKLEAQPLYRQSMALLRRESVTSPKRIDTIYRDFLQELADYWFAHGAVEQVDLDGLVNVFVGIFALLACADQFDHDYYDEIFATFVKSGIGQYIRDP